MTEVEVAEPMTALGLRYNQQSTNPSMYQKRVTSYLYPTQNATIDSTQSNKTIKFLVGSNFFLDGRNSYLRLQAKVDGTNVNQSFDANAPNVPYNVAIFTSYTETWIKSLTIYTNMGVVIEQIRDYNLLGAMLKMNIEPEYSQSVGVESLNIVDSNVNSLTVQQRQELAMNFKTYVIELRIAGFLKAMNYLPLRALAGQNSNSFQLEIEFANINDMVIAWQALGSDPVVPNMYEMSKVGAVLPTPNSGTGLKYLLQNIVFVQSLLQDDLMESSLMETIKSVPLMIHYETYRHYSNGITGSSGGNNTLSVSEYQESIRDMKSTFQYTALRGNQTLDTTSFIFPNLVQYQLQIGPIYFPSQPIPTSQNGAGTVPDLGEQYYEYCKCNQKAMFYSQGFSPSIFPDTGQLDDDISNKGNLQFVLTNDLRPFPDYSIGDPDFHEYITGYNTKASPQPLQLLLQTVPQKSIPNSLSTNVTCDSYTHYDAYCVIQSNEVYIIS